MVLARKHYFEIDFPLLESAGFGGLGAPLGLLSNLTNKERE
jgi:hypothetical protein